ncbi:MAG: Ig domain-containing protein, partial [Prevotella sp.]|nr:Ig domain-containing protein [Prevotella sp.]
NYQTIEDIPNGTYTVTVQAFTSGTDVKFYANDQEVDVKANDSGVANCSGAAALFKQGLYPNTVTVTVTERTLKIGFSGDCSNAKWLCYDDVTLYMTGYTANTGVSAEDVELQIGQNVEIGAATVPATASFNALTYASADKSIATVDANGVVTGVAVGNTTITITANEMENFSKTINVNVILVTPTAFALSESEVELDNENTSATLTVVPTPDGANDAATWTSSDETVATVVNGVVTAVSSGTATITATSQIDTEISASATVTVTFPESEVPASVEYADGSAIRVYTLGDNLFKNGTFGYPNAVATWKTVGYATDAVANNFTITSEGGAVNNGAYITTKGAGVGSENTIRKAIAVEVGKKYYFSVYTSGKAPTSANFQYNALFKMSDATTETGTLKQFEWPQGDGQTTSEWSKTEYVFTAETPYVGVRMGWNDSSSFDEFVLAEITDESTVGNVQYAINAIPTANIGTGAFQYSQDAINAANALVQGEATVEEVENAYEALTTVNEPEDGQLFNVVLTYNGYQYDNKAMTYIANGRNDAGNYNIQYKEAANKNLAQAFTFTKVSGNNYKMSQIDADGVARYISTGVPYSGNTSQIRTTTTADDALIVTVIPTATDGVYNLRNTEANQYIGSQDAGVYTVNSHIDFKLIETTKPSIAINTTAAGWGTTILPFAVAELPEGVKAYTCAETSGNTLTLVPVDALEANKPYIIEGAWNETLTGDAQGTALSYTEGLLTGTYETIAAPDASYILQKHDDKVGFFQVDINEAQPNVPANRAYLTASTDAGVKSFFLGDAATGISGVMNAVATGNIYDLGGRKVSKLQKGNVYIINGKKVAVK